MDKVEVYNRSGRVASWWTGEDMTVVNAEDPEVFGHDARVTLTGGGLGSIYVTVLARDIVDGRLNAETARLWLVA